MDIQVNPWEPLRLSRPSEISKYYDFMGWNFSGTREKSTFYGGGRYGFCPFCNRMTVKHCTVILDTTEKAALTGERQRVFYQCLSCGRTVTAKLKPAVGERNCKHKYKVKGGSVMTSFQGEPPKSAPQQYCSKLSVAVHFGCPYDCPHFEEKVKG